MLRFFSVAALSQIAIVLFQVVVFPLQIHVWGHELVAAWATAQAISAFISAGDLGLKNIGFSALAAGERDRFLAVWTVMRGQIVLFFAAASAFAFWRLTPDLTGPTALFPLIVMASGLADCLLMTRNAFMEARGRITHAETLFLLLAGGRLVLCAVAIGFFQAGPFEAALLWLGPAIAALVLQSRSIGGEAPLFSAFRLKGARAAYGEAKWSVTTPIVQWAQAHLPVTALSFFAPAQAISAFLALRVIFGLVRAVVVQVGRVVSVRYAHLSRTSEGGAAAMAIAVGTVMAWFSASIAVGVFAERLFLTGPLFELRPDPLVNILMLTFGLSAVFAIHQIYALTLARSSQFVLAGKAQYAFLGVLIGAALLAARFDSVAMMAVGLTLADLLLLGLSLWPFLRACADPHERAVRRIALTRLVALVCFVVAGWLLILEQGVLGPSPSTLLGFGLGLAAPALAALGLGLALFAPAASTLARALGVRVGRAAPAAPAAGAAE